VIRVNYYHQARLPRRAAGRGWAREQRRALCWGLLPTLGALALVTLAPAVWLIVTSLTPLTPTEPGSFDFSEPSHNYQQAFTSPEFLRSVWVQVIVSRRFDDLVSETQLVIEPVTEVQARIAREAYRDFGRGSGHAARLNFGDCFAYALARAQGEPLLFMGADFGHTDIKPALGE
jgi:uncharacterized protein with PIN domain